MIQNGYDKFMNCKWDLDNNGTDFERDIEDIDLDNLPLDLIFDNDETYSPSKSDTDVYSPSDDDSTVINSTTYPGFKIMLEGMPSKSRIENQIKLTIKFLNSESNSIPVYKRIFIDENLIDSCSLKKKKNKVTEDYLQTAKISPHLLLKCSVQLASDLTQEAFRCAKCIKRERKMKERKNKNNNDLIFNYFCGENYNDIISSNNDILDSRKIIQFHTGLFVDIKDNSATLPFRITCYSRHHNDLNGFILKMKLIDGYTNMSIFEFYTPKIVITDDRRKTKGQKENKRKQSQKDVYSCVPSSKKQKIQPSKENKILSVPCGVVNKIIPNEGPLCGGIEVTVLGKDFVPGHQCYFGGNKAITKFWNSGALICILPSSTVPGAASVTVSHSDNPNSRVYSNSPVFMYKDQDKKQKFMSLALQIIGREMTGLNQEAKKVAEAIINNYYSS